MRANHLIGQEVQVPYGALPHRLAPPARYDAALNIALVNNMPDSALLDTERHYRNLASAAAEQAGLRVHLSLFALDGIARSDHADRIIRQRYGTFGDLRRSEIDAVIITGAEPHTSELADEAIWPALTKLLDWAEEHTVSSLLSCLAAHAAALHFEGIRRTPLARKCSGVFDIEKLGAHALTDDVPSVWQAVHSRQNDLSEAALRAQGYTILGRTERAGVHLFVKRLLNLRVCFQGHPEYGSDTLLREYRRDVVRFLRREHAVYPETPHAYFDRASEQRLTAFRETAEQRRGREPMQDFPDDLVIQSPASTWQPAAVRVFANWLTFVGERTSWSGARRRSAAVRT